MATIGSVVRSYPKNVRGSQVILGWISKLLSERRRQKEAKARRKEIAKLRAEAAAVLEREAKRLYQWLIEKNCDETKAARLITSCGAAELRQWAIDGLIDRRCSLLNSIETLEGFSSGQTEMLLVTRNSPSNIRVETHMKNELLRLADRATLDFLSFWESVTAGVEGKSFNILQGHPWEDPEIFLGRKIDRVLTTLPLAS